MVKKRISYKNLTPAQAQKMIDESKGMSKAKWEKLWAIAHGRNPTIKKRRK